MLKKDIMIDNIKCRGDTIESQRSEFRPIDSRIDFKIVGNGGQSLQKSEN